MRRRKKARKKIRRQKNKPQKIILFEFDSSNPLLTGDLEASKNWWRSWCKSWSA
jgi:hypothetical protein